MHDDAEPVCRIENLAATDAFLVQAFRNWAVGLGEGRIRSWVAVSDAFLEKLGPDRAPAALERFENFMNTLGGHARRTIHFHAPGCPCVDADESAFVEMLARLESGADQRARSLAGTFVRATAVDELLECGRGLATALRCPPRATEQGPDRRDDPPGTTRTLH